MYILSCLLTADFLFCHACLGKHTEPACPGVMSGEGALHPLGWGKLKVGGYILSGRKVESSKVATGCPKLPQSECNFSDLQLSVAVMMTAVHDH